MTRKANRTETRKFNRVETRYFDGAKWQRYMTKHETDMHGYLRDTYPARTQYLFIDPTFDWAFGAWTEILREVENDAYKARLAKPKTA